MFGRSQGETRSQIAHAPSTRSIQSARVSDCGSVGWKAGFEIELMTPRVDSRLDLALRVARRRVGSIRRFFHPRQKPSKVPGSPTFENLTPGSRPSTREVARSHVLSTRPHHRDFWPASSSVETSRGLAGNSTPS